jgi:ribonucleotide reductase beta subunit family protein with ferritin-like domain
MDKMNNDETEPILTESQRFTLFPIKYPKIWDSYNTQRSCFWTTSEIDFSKDKQDWVKLNDKEQYFIKNILAFFAGSDGIVSVNIMSNFCKDIKILEAQMCYAFQTAIESIHAETYSLMIDTYIDNTVEKMNLFNAIDTVPCIKKKADWALKWCDPMTASFAHRLIGFAVVEGLFFSGAFCAIYWIKERGILPGLTKSNEFIARDERLHTDFACLLYSMLNHKLDADTVNDIIDEAVDIETEFITESLPVKLIGMNSGLMTQYIKYVADTLLINLGYPKLYNVKNPFTFMANIGLESRSNFFDERTSTYQKPVLANNHSLEIVEEF